MAHQLMFDGDVPFLERLREIALALPGAAEKVSHGRTPRLQKELDGR